ncbi:hypothetical protein K8I28_08660 [bacterium]|nr:hypothetical protein [bacterium]
MKASRISIIFASLAFFIPGILLAKDRIHNKYLPSAEILQNYSKVIAVEDYHSAKQIVDELEINDISTPWNSEWADLLKCGLLIFQMIDYGDTIGQKEYSQLLEQNKRSFGDKLKNALNAQDSAAALFALGTLEGFEASRLENEGSTFSAISPAKSSTNYLKEAVNLDDSLIDASLGVALYDYWTSKFLNFLHWTPFTRDKRPESILQIKNVMRNGYYSRYLAGAYLSWVLIEEERYNEAAAVADSFLLLLGESRAFLEPCGKACFMAENWVDAEDRYHRLIKLIRHAPRRNEVREIGAWHRLANIAHELKDWGKLIEIYEEVNKIELTDAQRSRKAKDIENISRFWDEAKRELKR